MTLRPRDVSAAQRGERAGIAAVERSCRQAAAATCSALCWRQHARRTAARQPTSRHPSSETTTFSGVWVN